MRGPAAHRIPGARGERPLQDDPGKVKPVRIDDACAFLVKFKNGAIGTFESTRYARGRKNQNTFEVNGDLGSVCFDLENAHRLEYFNNRDDSHVHGWRNILVTDFEHPYMDKYWVPGCTIGYEHTFINALSDFLSSLETDEPTQPDFRSAQQTQLVCDAVLKSADCGRWVKTEE